ncbi:hypothetical protein [Mesorhizobium japonicum]|uniref:hypothetical protein n=1 Tax=Mesorhizobium japonicum TaxID=2066070 RepID=UPI0007EE167F|nr:hypothetical protein A9K65_013400 [Mesorhizobium sp. WSM1497]PBC15737.1 hypothetical protein CK225_16290 [Mesorhizobium loti]
MGDDSNDYGERGRWTEACRREEAIREFLERYLQSLGGQELDLSPVTASAVDARDIAPSTKIEKPSCVERWKAFISSRHPPFRAVGSPSPNRLRKRPALLHQTGSPSNPGLKMSIYG